MPTQHNAMDQLDVVLNEKKITWVSDRQSTTILHTVECGKASVSAVILSNRFQNGMDVRGLYNLHVG